jgi:hypothetical protein
VGNTHSDSQQVNLIWLLLEAPWSELIARALLPLRPSEYPPMIETVPLEQAGMLTLA